jgi:type III secretion protein T
LLVLVGKELLLGLFIGFLVGLPLRLPQIVGDLIDNQRGAAVTSQFNPFTQQDDSILGQILSMCLVTYFFSEGGFSRLIGILSASFSIQSVASFEFGFGDNIYQVASVVLTNYLQLFAILCLPLMLVMLVADLSLGLGSKFAQSLNAFSMSQSIKAVIAIGMVISLHPRMMATYLRFFEDTTRFLVGGGL